MRDIYNFQLYCGLCINIECLLGQLVVCILTHYLAFSYIREAVWWSHLC